MKARNPILPLQYYCPDGEPHLIGDELFVYPSFNTTPGEYCCPKLYVAHSRDLEHWSVDGPAFGLRSRRRLAHGLPCPRRVGGGNLLRGASAIHRGLHPSMVSRVSVCVVPKAGQDHREQDERRRE